MKRNVYWSSCKVPVMLLIIIVFFDKHLNIKFDENWSSGSRGVSCGQRDMTRLIVSFRNFANVSQNGLRQKKSLQEFNFSQEVYKKLYQNSSNGLQHVTRVRTVPKSTSWWRMISDATCYQRNKRCCPLLTKKKGVLTYEGDTLPARVRMNRVLSLALAVGTCWLASFVCHPTEHCSWSLHPVEIDDYILQKILKYYGTLLAYSNLRWQLSTNTCSSLQ